MKNFWNIISILLFLHIVALAGFVAWMYSDGRIDTERIERVVAMFSTTIAEEAQLDMEGQADADALEVEVKEQLRLTHIADGSETMADRIAAEKASDEAELMRQDRLEREIADLQRMLTHAESFAREQVAMLAKERTAFDARLEEMEQKLSIDDFKKAVNWISELKPKQAKDIFQQYMAQKRTDEVVDLLAAMQPRNAASVIAQFKSPEDVVQAADLISRLRERGVEVTQDQSVAADGQGDAI